MTLHLENDCLHMSVRQKLNYSLFFIRAKNDLNLIVITLKGQSPVTDIFLVALSACKN